MVESDALYGFSFLKFTGELFCGLACDLPGEIFCVPECTLLLLDGMEAYVTCVSIWNNLLFKASVPLIDFLCI